MARPKTKGDPISIRLSQQHDELIRLQAEQAGIPVTQLATQMLEEMLFPAPPPAQGQRAHDPTCRCAMCRPELAGDRQADKAKAKKRTVGR